MAEAGGEQRDRVGQEGHLQPGLKRRHMTMIAIGGVIGAGLFVGTGPILNQAGPATILTYLITGCILILILLLTATNLYSVGSYGEFEFWFASIKVAAIIIFIALAALFVIGLLPGGGIGLSNLYAEGGFFPNGGLVMFSGVVTVIFAFVGAEIVTIAASESNEPEQGVARATNQVIYRILLFYVVSVFFLAAVVPWNTTFAEEVIKSPFTIAFQKMGIPFAPTLMNFVVLTAVLSVLNSSLYTTSRMLFALTRHNDAPQFLLNTTRRGVPMWAILAGTAFGYVSVVIYYFFPENVFTWLINASGAIALFAYLSIAAMVAVLIAMAVIPAQRPLLIASLVSLGVILIAYVIRRVAGPPERDPHEVIRERETEPAPQTE